MGVIGAGICGLVAGLELIKAGRPSLMIFERAAEVGGVWRDNVYPGCACDVRSHLYALAARPNPDWTSTYAKQPEILAYLKGVAERDLAAHIRFNAEVVEARFVEMEGCWRLAFRDGGVCHVRSLILALGPLNRTFIPPFEGLERFQGTTSHSSTWNPATILAGLRVAVVGTAASAVQIVPNIAARVERLTVFQRSAPWVFPRSDRATTTAERWLYRRVPAVHALMRSGLYWAMEAVGAAFFGNQGMKRFLQYVARRKLAREVRDPETRRKLTPDYALGCKRMTVSDDFYPAFNRQNVELVTEPIAEIAETGVRTRDGVLHEVDHIVFATGFIVSDPEGLLRVVGVDGRVLADDWAGEGGVQAYRGVAVSGYPNMAMLLGPNSGLSYASVIHMAESQVAYLRQYLDALDCAGPSAVLDVRPVVQAGYNADVQAKLAGSVWASGCTSWYLSRSGRNTAIFPGRTSEYRRLMSHFDAEAYEIRHAGGVRTEDAA